MTKGWRGGRVMNWGLITNLALDHNNPSFVVDANTARMLKDIRSKLPHKLPVLVVYLDLVRRRPEKKHNLQYNVSA